MKKNILKRIFALVLVMVMALGLTGCASPEGQYNAANKLLIKGEYEKLRRSLKLWAASTMRPR